MKRIITIIAFCLSIISVSAARFEKIFADSTLRFDISVESSDRPKMSFSAPTQTAGWWGRRVNLDCVQYCDELTYSLIDSATGKTIYKATKYLAETAPGLSSSTIFIPKPQEPAMLKVSLGYSHNNKWVEWLCDSVALDCARLATLEDAMDRPATPYALIRKAADPRRAINFAFVAEGYQAEEMDRFYRDAITLDSALFAHQSFADYADRFNVVAVMLPSDESGISRPSRDELRHTALGAHFDSYNMDRLITIPDARRLWDALAGVPASYALIMANTPDYGGSGSYNEYCIASAGNYWWQQIMVHELGHSFAMLADEYEAGFDETYHFDVEPAEPNITTLVDFTGKWQPLIDSGEASLVEGGGYHPKGVWRGCPNCLMRELGDLKFCVVCRSAIGETIEYLTVEQ